MARRPGGWETVCVFGADNLVGWVIGRLLNAGYKKLSTRLLGTDQNRALKEALTAAVETTVRGIGPSNEEEVERVARRIDKAFHRREPVPQLPGEPSQLEALQAGIAAQLSVLDDAGQTAVSPLGVPVSDVAAKLTEHLVHEITDRGAEGGPLFPLAVLLGQDRAYQLGEQIKGMVAELLRAGRASSGGRCLGAGGVAAGGGD